MQSKSYVKIHIIKHDMDPNSNIYYSRKTPPIVYTTFFIIGMNGRCTSPIQKQFLVYKTAQFLTQVILYAKHKKIVWNNQDFFLSHMKASVYCSLKKKYWIFQTIFSCLTSKIIDVRHQANVQLKIGQFIQASYSFHARKIFSICLFC